MEHHRPDFWIVFGQQLDASLGGVSHREVCSQAPQLDAQHVPSSEVSLPLAQWKSPDDLLPTCNLRLVSKLLIDDTSTAYLDIPAVDATALM